MNVYEAIRTYLTESMYNVNGYDARVSWRSQLTMHAALAPDWAKLPGWVQYYAICIDGVVLLSESDIEPYDGTWVDADEPIGVWEKREPVTLPLGIDWRLCKWQRPEAK